MSSIGFLKKYFLFIVTTIFLVLWVFVFKHQLLLLSKDFSFNADIVSVDNFYDEDRGEYSGGIYSKTDYRYETIATEGGVATIKNSFSVRTPEDVPIFSVERLYGVDRYSTMHVIGAGDKDRGGYLFAPRHLDEGEPYSYWHINYDSPAQMEYVGKERLYGLTVYKYETRYSNVRIDQTANLSYLPEVGTTRGIEVEPYLQVWVEPTTGRLLKYADNTIAYYYDLETRERIAPWNQFSNIFNEASVEKISQEIRWEKTKTITFEIYVPVVLFIIALLSLLYVRGSLSRLRTFIIKKNMSAGVGISIIVIAGVFFTAWLFGVTDLITAIPGASVMNPMTAISFVLLGVGMFYATQKKTATYVVALCGASLILIGVLRITAILELFSWSVDLVFFKNTIMSLAVPARMGFFTAISFCLFGITLLSALSSRLRKIHIIEVSASVSVIFASFAILSFLFDGISFFEVPVFYSVSIYTSALFFVSGLVLYSYFREKDDYTLPFMGWMSVSGILLVCIIITVSITSFLEQNLQTTTYAQFETQISRSKADIENRLKTYINLLEGGKGLFVASDFVDRSEWQRYTTSLDLQMNYPGIQGMGYAEFVSPENKQAYEAEVQADGFPDFSIRPEGEREVYTSIIYLEPFDERNRQAFGYDMYSNDIRRSAMEQALDTGEPKMSGAITLVQEIDEDVQPGFLIYVPHYENDTSQNTLEERRETIIGYVYAAFRARNFVVGALGEDALSSSIGLKIEDGIGQQESVLYDDVTEKFGSTLKGDRFTQIKTMYVAGRPWKLTYVSAPNFGQGLVERVLPLLSLLVGVGVSVLITLIFYVLILSRQKAIIAVQKATRQLQEANAQDEAILGNIAEGLVVIDKKGKFLIFNNRAKEILGKGPTAKKPAQWPKEYGMRNSKTERLINIKSFSATKALQGKSVIGEELFIKNDKVPEGVYIKINTSPVTIEGKIVGAVFTFIDVSKEKQIDRAKTEFVSLASHQLRTPVTAINWYAELLQDESAKKLTKMQREYVSEIHAAAHRMTSLINSLLNVSRLELGTVVIDPKPADIVAVASEAVKEQQANFKKKKQKLTFTFDKKIPTINIDTQITHMVIQNLLSNANKYTPEKGNIHLAITLVKKGRRSSYVSIICKDTGYGIPKKEQKNMFKKLHRADNIKQLDVEGTGLGLYIVKTVVETSGSEISFESEENKGTTFEIKIPLTGMKKKDGGKKLNSFE